MLAENTFLNRDTYYVTPPSLPRDRIARMNAPMHAFLPRVMCGKQPHFMVDGAVFSLKSLPLCSNAKHAHQLLGLS